MVTRLLDSTGILRAGLALLLCFTMLGSVIPTGINAESTDSSEIVNTTGGGDQNPDGQTPDDTNLSGDDDDQDLNKGDEEGEPFNGDEETPADVPNPNSGVSTFNISPASTGTTDTTFHSVAADTAVIAHDGTFGINFITLQHPPITAGDTVTIIFPDNIEVPNGTYDVPDVWWDNKVVAATVKVLDGEATITIAQGMVDLIASHGNYPEYYLNWGYKVVIPGAKFKNQASLGGTTQAVKFTTSTDQTFTSNIAIQKGPDVPEDKETNTKITTVSIKESSIATDGTFTVQATTYQNSPVRPGDSTTITFPDNIIVPDGTYDVYNTWFNTQLDVVVAVVTVKDNVATITIAQGMKDFLDTCCSAKPYPEFYAYPEIPGAKFVDQVNLGGTTQSVEFKTSAGGPFTDKVYILPKAEEKDTKILSTSIREGVIATDGTFTIDITTYQNPPITAGSTSTVVFPDNIIVPDGTWDVYNTWFGEPDLITGTVTVSDNVATITITQEMVDFLDRHNWGEYYLYPSIPGAKFVGQDTLGGTWQSATFTTSNGGPFTDRVFILGDTDPAAPKVLDVHVAESVIPLDGTFTIKATTYQTPPLTAGTSYTITFPDNIIVPNGEYPVYDVWWDNTVVAATVKVEDGIGTVTIEQGMVDLVTKYNWFEYYLYPSIPGAKFVNQETLGGTWQDVVFESSNGGPFNDKVYVLPTQPEPDPTAPKVTQVHIKESVISTSDTFTILATTWQKPPLVAGTSYTITFPDNIIVPNGTYPVNDVWWESDVVVASVKVENGVGTVTIEQGMVDLVTKYNWFEYYLYPSIPGAKFVNQANLGGTWQSGTFTSSNGGPFSDSVYILPEGMVSSPSQPGLGEVSVDDTVIPVEGCFTVDAAVNYSAPVTPGSTVRIVFPANTVVKDGESEFKETVGGQSVVVATVSVKNNVATVTATQGMVDHMTMNGVNRYVLNLEFECVTFAGQDELGGTRQSVTITASNGGPHSFAVTILPEGFGTTPTETPDPTDPSATPDPTDPSATPDPTDPSATPDPTDPSETPAPTDPATSTPESEVTSLPKTGTGANQMGLNGQLVAVTALSLVAAAFVGLVTLRKKA